MRVHTELPSLLRRLSFSVVCSSTFTSIMESYILASLYRSPWIYRIRVSAIYTPRIHFESQRCRTSFITFPDFSIVYQQKLVRPRIGCSKLLQSGLAVKLASRKNSVQQSAPREPYLYLQSTHFSSFHESCHRAAPVKVERQYTA